MNLNKEDIERIAEAVIEKLDIEVSGASYYTDDRTIKLKLGDRVIATAEFSVKSMKDDDYPY